MNRANAEKVNHEAWFEHFSKRLGSTQLSHASAKLDMLEAHQTDTSAPYWLCYLLAGFANGYSCLREGDRECCQTDDCITEWCAACAATSWLEDQRKLMLPAGSFVKTDTTISIPDHIPLKTKPMRKEMKTVDHVPKHSTEELPPNLYVERVPSDIHGRTFGCFDDAWDAFKAAFPRWDGPLGEVEKKMAHRFWVLGIGSCREEIQALKKIPKMYYELLYAVERKFEGETRHQTALRYIQIAEYIKDNDTAKEAK